MNPKGKKGQGLVWLLENTDLGYNVPEFEIIDTSIYNEWKQRELIAKIAGILKSRTKKNNQVQTLFKIPTSLERRCEEISEKFKGRPVSIRSSAVFSEDGDKHSGSGIYHTDFIKDARLVNSASLCNSTITVYESVDSNKAIQYRKEKGIEYEEMEVIIQLLKDNKDDNDNIVNGVMQSRLEAVPQIIPIMWSRKIGAVVNGDTSESPIHTMYFSNEKRNRVFESDTKIPINVKEFMGQELVSLILKLKERYKKDFAAEFSVDLNNELIDMLQIKLLTNVTDKKITFPDKKPIMTAKYCMGAGEYIGQWVIPPKVEPNWQEPKHYALALHDLNQSLQKVSSLCGYDYDALTKNKKAMILTGEGFPGMHALTIANEKGIICVVADKIESDDEFRKKYRLSRTELSTMGNDSRAVSLIPTFDVLLNEIGDYVHVVTDGLKGFVYKATKEEAEIFAKLLHTKVTYDVSQVKCDMWREPFYDVELNITPSEPGEFYDICERFVDFLKQKTNGKIYVKTSPAKNSFEIKHPNAELEVFCAYFNPDEKEKGVNLSGGRSSHEITDKETAKKWFEEFAKYYKPK